MYIYTMDYPFKISDDFSTQPNIDALIVQVDIAVTDNTRTNTVWVVGLVTFTYQNPLTAANVQAIQNIIYADDPKSNPIGVQLMTFPGMTITCADVNGNTINYLGSRPSEIHISKDTQNDYTSIRAALDAHTGNDLIFIVHPGIYNENNPLPVRDGCVLVGYGTYENTVIIADNPNSDLITLGIGAKVENFTLRGATGARGLYFDAGASNGAGSTSVALMCTFEDCLTAVECDGNNVSSGTPDTLYIRETKIYPITMNTMYGICAHSKGKIISEVLFIDGISGSYNVGTGAYVSDMDSKITIALNSFTFLNKAIGIDGGGELEVTLITVRNCNIGVEIGSMGMMSMLCASGLQIKDSVQYDLNILSSDADITINSGSLNDLKFNNPNGVKISAIYNVYRYGKLYQQMTGNSLIGSSTEPSKLFAGEGYYDMNNVHILSNSNMEAGAFVDNTNAALDSAQPPYNLFQGTAVGNCVYIGRQTNPVGCKIQITTATSSAVPKSSFVFEYWSGTAWEELYTNTTYAVPPYYNMEDSFVSEANTYQIYFGIYGSDPALESKTINGHNAKWVRIRVVTALPSIPQAHILVPHPNSILIGNDGFTTYFGDSRTISKLGLEYVDRIGNAATPGDQYMYLSKDVYMRFTKNSFLDSTTTGVTFAVTLPKNTDVSFPLKLTFSYAGSSATAGNVFWRVRYSSAVTSGAAIYQDSASAPSDTPDEKTKTILSPVTAIDTTISCVVKMSIEDVLVNLQGDKRQVLWLVLERDGADASDTYPGNANVFDMSLWTIACSEGIHLSGY
jgi:hypothetical protein